ncbi:carbohydrate ABC transporter permease [Bradyrhizobium valentinum]|uniref:Sugar ABC transporter permease n=1 Tax=Bradyrhizobium valentinum TaxID=1518501 RepID=A0A0R3KP27_9BRAD|nr:carbohydrate ABC transporter permease [Bradyrhizobium valentinum]KRQ97194.1 sugar ABC transporter permease [Bradyrhizobium valentinum]KRR05245.1 sugar ABC transporter permease [Bradyrhizobium valentinum]
MIARFPYRRFAGRIARHAILILTAAFALLPFVWMVSLSLKPPEEIFQADFHLWPTAFHGVENYRVALTAAPMFRFLLNGLLVCTAIFALQLLVCIPCAYALAKLRFRGRDTLFSAVLVGLLLPPQALAIPHFVLLNVFGLLDTYAALILPWVISTFGIFLLRQFFRSIPDEIIHAARLDGLGEFEIIWRIMIPMTTPALAAFGIFSIVAHWNDLFWPLIAVRSAEISTPALGILLFRDDEAGQFLGPLMAGAVIIVAPLLVAFLIAQRRFIDGLAVTTMK